MNGAGRFISIDLVSGRAQRAARPDRWPVWRTVAVVIVSSGLLWAGLIALVLRLL